MAIYHQLIIFFSFYSADPIKSSLSYKILLCFVHLLHVVITSHTVYVI